jgi:hypothetical protein
VAKPGRRRGGKESIGGYFRRILNRRPALLNSKSNKELMRKWDADHPGQDPADRKRVMQNLANVKSNMRKKLREADKADDKGGPPKIRLAPGNRNRTLEVLEEHIDDSLTLAKNLDRVGLDSVIKLLRHARNQVVWKLGE